MASLLLPALCLGAPSGSLLFVDLLSTKPYIFGLQALGLTTLKTTLVLDLGPAESFYDQTSAAGGGSYFATVQHPGAPVDPWRPSSECSAPCVNSSLCCADPNKGGGYCLSVTKCSDINSGHGEWEETLAVTLPTALAPSGATIRSRFNTSDCYKLAYAGPDELLCIAASTVGEPITLRRLDTKARTNTLVGSFPEQLDCVYDEAAGYDPTTQTFYAWLGDASGDGGALHAMNATTGVLLPTRKWAAESQLLVQDFAIDPATGTCYAAVENRTDGTWRMMLATLELAGPADQPIAWAPVSADATDTFGVVTGHSPCSPGSSAGAAKKCYDQLNNAFFADGTFFITGFSHNGTAAVPEAVLGVDVKTATITLEHEHTNGNMVDMAWTPWEA